MPDRPQNDGTATSEWRAPTHADAGLWGYLRPLVLYWWVMAPLAVLGGALGLAYCYYVEPIYRAHCRFEIFENEMLRIADQPGLRDNAFYYFNVNPLERHIVLLTSRNLDVRIRKRLAGEWGGGAASRPAALNVQPVEQAARVMVDITVDSYRPEYSKAYIGVLIEEYSKLRREEMVLVHDDTVQSLRAEQEKLAAQLKSARDEVMEFEAEHNLQFEEKKSESELEHMRDILRKARSVNTQRTILDSQLRSLADADAATLRDVLDLTAYSATTGPAAKAAGRDAAPAWSEMPEWQRNEGDLIRLEAQYKNLRSVYKPEHPKMTALQEKIDMARQEGEIAASLTMKRLVARRDALRMQEQALEEAAGKIQAGINLTTADRAKRDNLRATTDHLKSLYDKVFTRIINSSSAPRDRYFSRIVEGPTAYGAPVWPVKWRMVALGIAAAAGCGAALVYLLFFRWMRLYNLDHVESAMQLAPLGSIPRVTKADLRADPRRLNKMHKADPICEAYRIIRTSIEEKLGDDRVVLITSPEQAEGKTFTCAHTAIACSWNRAKVLLIDGDFRKPTQRKIFKLEDTNGLAECLADESLSWRDYVIKGVAGNLDMLPAGHAKGNAAELLQTASTSRIFDEIRSEYDLIIIDSAPVNRVVDTVLLAKMADVVALVTQPGRTSVPSIHKAVRRLSAANLIGYIANRTTASTQRYYSEYGGYGYYHSRRDYYYKEYR